MVGAWATSVRTRMRRDDGDASIQMAIVFPFVIALTIAVVQTAMWFHARDIALTAAREGVNAGRGYQSTPGDGAARARATLDRIGGDSLRDSAVSTDGSTNDTVTITVSGSAISMLPGIPDLHVSQSASATREQWTAP
ncbi:TadE/TadG family type IV pilus assembly protein [Actinacidiphila rubida]|uniref:TadE-like protein n=1 Tax=Actinacidiphila rubida TaxID=310780 RepID=A0A1H8TER3_9ACTN|nr:TadE family protein [Actinacidiphila rubida]SEO89325.1 TadE-like protein [Actinacidiphila rubida]